VNSGGGGPGRLMPHPDRLGGGRPGGAVRRQGRGMGRGCRLLAVRARAGVPRPRILPPVAARVEGKNGAAVAGLLEGGGAAVAGEEGVVVGGGVRVRVLVAEEDGGGGLRREGVVQVADKKEQYCKH
jgi:hypothetical protein